MRKETAKEVAKELLFCSGKLDQSVTLVRGVVGENFYLQYRALVGQIMGTLYIELLRDIFQQHPELEPDSMK